MDHARLVRNTRRLLVLSAVMLVVSLGLLWDSGGTLASTLTVLTFALLTLGQALQLRRLTHQRHADSGSSLATEATTTPGASDGPGRSPSGPTPRG